LKKLEVKTVHGKTKHLQWFGPMGLNSQATWDPRTFSIEQLAVLRSHNNCSELRQKKIRINWFHRQVKIIDMSASSYSTLK
jgi:hypothetical protein